MTDPRQAIIDTVAAWGAHNPDALIRTAERESYMTPTAIGDHKGGPQAFERTRDRIRGEGNPWSERPERCAGSFGLFQMMPAYHLRLWDPQGDPYLLFDPYVSTVIAGRLWNRGVNAGATDFVRMRLWWKYPSWVNKPVESPEYQERLASKFSVVDGVRNPPTRIFDYRPFGTGPQKDQLALLAKARGNRATTSPATSFPWLTVASIAYAIWKAHRNA